MKYRIVESLRGELELQECYGGACDWSYVAAKLYGEDVGTTKEEAIKQLKEHAMERVIEEFEI